MYSTNERLYRNKRVNGLSQGIKKLVSGKLVDALEKTKQAKDVLSKADLSRAVEILVKKRGLKLGAGDTIVVDGKLPVEVVSGLTAINVDTSELSAVESSWVLTLQLPELYFEQLFSLEALKNGMMVNLPNVNMPDVGRLDVNEDGFRNNVAEWQGGITQRWVVSDVRLKDTLNQIKALMQWARNVKPGNIYLIIDGELGKLKDRLNANVNGAINGTKKLAEDILTYIVKPRDAMLNALVGSMRDSFDTLKTAIQFQDQAMQEITNLYTGIATTAEAITGQSAGEGDDPAVLLQKVRATAESNKKLLDSEITRLQTALNEITKALGV